MTRVNLSCLDFGGGANDGGVKLSQGRTQFFRGIGLLHHLVAFLQKLLLCVGVDSVGY